MHGSKGVPVRDNGSLPSTRRRLAPLVCWRGRTARRAPGTASRSVRSPLVRGRHPGMTFARQLLRNAPRCAGGSSAQQNRPGRGCPPGSGSMRGGGRSERCRAERRGRRGSARCVRGGASGGPAHGRTGGGPPAGEGLATGSSSERFTGLTRFSLHNRRSRITVGRRSARSGGRGGRETGARHSSGPREGQRGLSPCER